MSKEKVDSDIEHKAKTIVENYLNNPEKSSPDFYEFIRTELEEPLMRDIKKETRQARGIILFCHDSFFSKPKSEQTKNLIDFSSKPPI